MLSAHKPYERYPDMIRQTAAELGAGAQVAGGVPAMCDGVTQGHEGMELSLFSRDVIAMATAIALSHDVFQGALLLGICDKIVPGLLMGALQFGHLPVVFVPAGPMTTGLSNSEKSRIRQDYALGKVDRETLLAAEQASYHGEGTCTFFGTANSNQMLLECMGLQLPGSSFINPGTDLRQALDRAAVHQAVANVRSGDAMFSIGEIVCERSIVNAMVGLLASGGSTNHTLHLVAIARAAGILIDWDDFSDLSACVPLLACVYPNGSADVNAFHAAGGVPFLIRELLQTGLMYEDVPTILGRGLHRFAVEPGLQEGGLLWRPAAAQSPASDILRPTSNPFSSDGGLRVLSGNLGRAVIKVSAVAPEHRRIVAPAVVVDSQEALAKRFKAGELERDFVAVVRGQGPRSNGMPELHKLTPLLGALQDKGYRVALVTDGRMSGASGKVPAAIHLSPDSALNGPICLLQEGDLVELDCTTGQLRARVDEAQWRARTPWTAEPDHAWSVGRGLFTLFRQHVSDAERGASPLL
jgi:phosphogluconate dehydratase